MTTNVSDSQEGWGYPIQRDYLQGTFRQAGWFKRMPEEAELPFPRLCITNGQERRNPQVTDPGFCLGHHRSPLTSADTKEGGLFGLWLEHHFGDQKLTFPGRDGSAGNTLMAKASDPSLIPRNACGGRRGQTPANFPLA